MNIDIKYIMNIITMTTQLEGREYISTHTDRHRDTKTQRHRHTHTAHTVLYCAVFLELVLTTFNFISM